MDTKEADAMLVSEVRSGKTSSYDILVKKYEKRIFRVAFGVLNDIRDAEDVVQISFMRAFSALHSFRGDSSFYTWLFRITINCTKDVHVRAARSKANVDLVSSEIDVDIDVRNGGDYDCPMGILQSKQVLHALDRVLEILPTEQRRALMLREVDGLSYHEVSKIMNCPIGTS